MQRSSLDVLSSELRQSWRGLRRRGVHALLAVALLAFALAANAIVFSTADSFVFNRAPYRDAHRLVEIGRQGPFGWSSGQLPEAFPAWRSFTDLFTNVFAWAANGAGTYISTGENPRFIADAVVEPGLLELLGARPIAGRLFVADDAHAGPPTVAVLNEDLAAEVFGTPQRAVNQTMKVGKASVTVIGVLPSAFRFPSAAEPIWTPLHLASRPSNNSAAFLAKVVPGMTLEALTGAIRSREASVKARLSPPWNKSSDRGPLDGRLISPAQGDPRVKRIFIALWIAAASLFLIACANVMNIELAMSLERMRTNAVEIALGATTGAVIRPMLLEGLWLVGGATLAGGALAQAALRALSTALPTAVSSTLANPLDVDARTMLFFVGAAAVAWLLVVIPVVIMAARADVVDALRLDTRSASVTRRGARLRHALTVTEIALTVALVASATLSAKSYASLLELPKGFDTTQLATVAVRQRPGSTEKDADLQQRLLETLTRQKGVASVSAGDLPPGAGGGSNSQPSIVGREESLGRVTFRSYDVDPGFFTTMRLPIVRGRALEAGDPPEAVVIDEAFAKRFWPNGDAVGARMDLGKVGWSVRGQFVHELQIVGVAAHLRGATDIPTTTSDGSLIYYRQLFDYAPLTFVVRLDGMSVESLKAVVKSSTPDSRLRIDLVDERYANLFANEMLAAAIMRAFAVFAAIVAIGGVYGIMSFLVAGRRREIGIRMALGADQRDVKRLVIGSAARLALTGTAIGITIAVAGARVFESVLYGVSASDPRPYLVIALGATAAAVFATWQPARRAAGVNPSQLLRD